MDPMLEGRGSRWSPPLMGCFVVCLVCGLLISELFFVLWFVCFRFFWCGFLVCSFLLS